MSKEQEQRCPYVQNPFTQTIVLELTSFFTLAMVKQQAWHHLVPLLNEPDFLQQRILIWHSPYNPPYHDLTPWLSMQTSSHGEDQWGSSIVITHWSLCQNHLCSSPPVITPFPSSDLHYSCAGSTPPYHLKEKRHDNMLSSGSQPGSGHTLMCMLLAGGKWCWNWKRMVADFPDNLTAVRIIRHLEMQDQTSLTHKNQTFQGVKKL